MRQPTHCQFAMTGMPGQEQLADDAGRIREKAVAFALKVGGIRNAKGFMEFTQMVSDLSQMVYGDRSHTGQILNDLRRDVEAA